MLSLIPSAVALGAPVNPIPRPSVTFNGAVQTSVYWGDVIYVGGDFTRAIVNGKYIARTRLAAIDARNGALLDWAPAADARVTAIDADGNGVYLAGAFRTINGMARDSLAKVNLLHGGLVATFKHNIYGQPHSISVGNGRVYLGGSLISVDGRSRPGAAAFNLSTGALDSAWKPAISGTVRSVLATSERIYLGGKFTAVNGALRTAKVAAVTPESGTVDAGFLSPLTAMVHKLTLAGGTLYAALDGQGGRATAMNHRTGEAKWTVTTDGDVQAVAVLDSVVYLGGHFDHVCLSANVGAKGICLDGSTRRVKLAAVDLSGTLLSWTADGNGSIGVETLSSNTQLGQVVAGGEYTTINGQPQRRFALFDPTSATKVRGDRPPFWTS